MNEQELRKQIAKEIEDFRNNQPSYDRHMWNTALTFAAAIARGKVKE